ncbi:TauD/TfdA dioxygenase family protein [Nocardia aurantia]|uniref:Alpha-ketoglutarate-dependent 2,4-dichlorophenoxyacetate dioxygenase n=1 Tax=Nocardia aurantia TaxID=2585199 RepID=A0A7K0DUZ0_9NOCA|nr:TauD/TfdA family dioxygenase [Nocardia aurantia]MQY29569.1 Alpha-ketoglutarate-dependent 2,4-dichlorophenoxyacetate dioxygenase [Nocardia aurantia]
MSITVTPLSDSIGVEVRGLTGAQLVDPAVAGQCTHLLHRHGVVVYREAAVGEPDLVAFSRLLGEVVVAPHGGLADHPEISPVTLDPAKSTLADYRRSTFHWHTDGLTDDVPQKATLLIARETAADGGDTEFANTYAAHEALPEAEQARLSTLRVVHSFAASQRLIHPDPTARQQAQWDRIPAREHPLVWNRPDGRRSLLIGATAAEVVGMSPAEGRELLDDILGWTTRPRFVLRHSWHVGDLVVWDNTGLLHRALPYEPTSRRLMHRTTLVGEEKVA